MIGIDEPFYEIAVSDKYGRKRILILTMLGNIASTLLWVTSTTFSQYLLSRLVGGLSEGNVQLSQAIISDVSTPLTRSKNLALVGIAFSVCFTFGPSIGAWFASRDKDQVEAWINKVVGGATTVNVYAVPALVALALLIVETGFLSWGLVETRSWKSTGPGQNRTASNDRPSAGHAAKKEDVKVRKQRLERLGRLHGLFLLCFSGVSRPQT